MTALRRASALGLATSIVAIALASRGCSSSVVAEDPCPAEDGTPIATYCDEVLPAMCTYAVQTCGVGTTVAECVSGARTTCCQGGCSRLACTPARADVARCVHTYAGPDAAFDATPEDPTGNPLPCSLVEKGYAPAECRNVVKLK